MDVQVKESGHFPMGIGNLAFVMESMHRSTNPLQQYRELHKNAEEAIDRAVECGLLKPGEGRIVWDVDWLHLQSEGVYKLCCVDNGVGMDGNEIVQYLNKYSSSAGTQAINQNFGVGARITAFEGNPWGVVYTSWKGSGPGVMAVFAEQDGQPGLVGWDIGDGRSRRWVTVQDDQRHFCSPRVCITKDHGTKVTLLGRNEEDNTFEAPLGAQAKQVWLARYLNSKFFRFSPNVGQVHVRRFSGGEWPTEGWNSYSRKDGEEVSRQQLYLCTGAEAFLSKASKHRGSVKLKTHATVHWWILDDDDEKKVGWGNYANIGKGHVAALFQDELYELKEGREGKSTLQRFGILGGADLVVLYVEPTHDTTHADPTRSMLKMKGRLLPWDVWAAEWHEVMPKEIQDLIDRSLSNDDQSYKTVDQRLKRVAKFHKISIFQKDPEGEVKTEGSVPVPGDKRPVADPPTPSPRPRTRVLSSRQAVVENGQPSKEVSRRSPYPDHKWQTGDECGLAWNECARYLPEDHCVLINEDYHGYKLVVGVYEEKLAGAPAAVKVAIEEVRGWFVLQLKEAIMVCLEEQEHDKTVYQEITERSLNMAVSPKFNCFRNVNDDLRHKIKGQRGILARLRKMDAEFSEGD